MLSRKLTELIDLTKILVTDATSPVTVSKDTQQWLHRSGTGQFGSSNLTGL